MYGNFGMHERQYVKASQDEVQRNLSGWDHRSEDKVDQPRQRASVLSTLSTIFVLMLAILRKFKKVGLTGNAD